MTRDDINRMAREAGWTQEYLEFGDVRLERFANLVASSALAEQDAEREPPARVVDVASLILSDCGCSANDETLLMCVTDRIWRMLLVEKDAEPMVPLTDEEIEAAWKSCDPQRLLPSFARAIEAALKEKNYD